MKAITIAGAVEHKKLNKDDLFNCENGVYRVGGVAFRDDHPASMLSVVDTIVRSNNICTYKIAERLGKLSAKFGVFSVLGNHDWAGDGKALWTALESAGIKVLENESVYVPFGEKGFYIVGLADYLTRDPRYRETIADIQNDLPKIVISHDPYTFKDMPSSVLLQLSGHTHGGQVALPLVGPVINPTKNAPLRWLYGMIEEKGNRMIASSGVGTSVLPIKNTPNEVVLVTIETSTILAS